MEGSVVQRLMGMMMFIAVSSLVLLVQAYDQDDFNNPSFYFRTTPESLTPPTGPEIPFFPVPQTPEAPGTPSTFPIPETPFAPETPTFPVTEPPPISPNLPSTPEIPMFPPPATPQIPDPLTPPGFPGIPDTPLPLGCAAQCAMNCMKKRFSFMTLICMTLCDIKCKIPFSEFEYNCAVRCARSMPYTFISDEKQVETYVNSCQNKCLED